MSHKIVDEYFDYYLKYTKEYGEKTCILMQIGSFYELEMVKNEKEQIGNLDVIAKILNIQITKKNKNISCADRSNPFMAGFPSISLSKFLPVLLENDFTVVVIDQVSGPPNVKREVVGIYSPSIYPIELMSSNSSCKLSTIIIEEQSNKNIVFTACIIDINTNDIIIHTENKTDNIIDDIYNIIQQYSLRELVIYNLSTTEFLSNNDILIHVKKDIPRQFQEIDYQNKTFHKIFSHIDFGIITPIEFFNLERYPLSSINLLMCLDFISSHSPKYICNLEIPKIHNNGHHLDLLLNTISQLNVISNNNQQRGKTSSLLNIIDNTLTTIGRRHLQSILTKPFKDSSIINNRYKLTEQLQPCQELIKELLSNVTDFVQLHRKMGLNTISTNEFYELHQNYITIISLHDLLQSFNITECKLHENTLEQLHNYMIYYQKIFNFEMIQNNISDFIFHKGVFDDIDEINKKVSILKDKLEKIRQMYDSMIKGDGFIKISYTDNDGYFLSCTKIRGQQIKLKDKSLNIKFTSNSCKISSNEIDQLSNELSIHLELLKKNIDLKYQNEISQMFFKYNTIFQDLQQFIQKLDVSYSNIQCKIKYNYCRPTIQDTENNSSYLKACDIRHPIIERVLTDTPYVPNTITLDDTKNGMILYALNSCGKSSLLRSVGLCIILAQAGLYVPCSDFYYSPFDKLITQVDMSDNLWKSKSSFVSEMIGLRNIINHSDGKTLVLSDELTKGTEVVSATSIFTTAALTLSEKNTKFIFTTHLQDVSKFKCIKDSQKINICHLSVNIHNDVITFERKLKPGPCSELYGLEVAKAIGLDNQFMKKAFQLRNEILQEKSSILSKKRSRYNIKKIVDFCEICDYKPFSSNDIPLDVHHIHGQCTADQNNFIEHFHKNSKHNLVTLCKRCHQNVHKELISISGYIQTSKGIQLQWDSKIPSLTQNDKN